MMGKRIYMRVPAFLLAGILAALGPSVPAAAAQKEEAAGAAEAAGTADAVDAADAADAAAEGTAAAGAQKPRYEAGSDPVLTSRTDLRDYLRICLDAGQRTAAFYYEGPLEDLEGSEAARMSGALYCRIRIEDDGTSRYCRVEMLPHAGEKILEAYRAGDLSGLTEREQETLDLALKTADDLREAAGFEPLYREAAEEEKAEEKAAKTAEETDEEAAEEAAGEAAGEQAEKEATEDTGSGQAPEYLEDLGLERRIHDWICDRVEYCAEVPADFAPEEAPAYLSAVGALLDGSANCQGYTDAFLLIASLAGYQVSSQSCEDPATGNGHVFNTVRLGENWYAVDVTNDDNAIRTEDGPRRDYHLFNAGMDVIGEQLTWPEELTAHPIAETSDDRYFYYWDAETGTDGYRRCFDEIDALAEAAVAYGFRDGAQMPVLMMWRGHEDRTEALDEALQRVLQEQGRACSYSYCLVLRGGSSFYQIGF